MTPELTPEEYVELVEAADSRSPKHGFTVYLLGHTGMKRIEVAHFTPEWHSSKHHVITIPKEQNGWTPQTPHQIRKIPLSSQASAQIDHYLKMLDDNAFQVHPSTITKRVKSIGQEIDMGWVSPRNLRHLYGERLFNLGIEDLLLVGYQT